MQAARPENEELRLAALRECRIMDTPPEEAYDAMTRLAAQICTTPIATLTFLDKRRQWFKSAVGIDSHAAAREFSFCAHVILGAGLMIVPDAAQDERFMSNPLVTGNPYIRFYAGAPLVTSDGFALGTLCVIDQVPRELTELQASALMTLARQVAVNLDLQRRLNFPEARPAKRDHAIGASESEYRKLAESDVIGVVTWGLDGSLTTVNDKFLDMIGYSRADFAAGLVRWDAMTPPEWKASCDEAVRHLRVSGIMAPYRKEFFRKDGSRLPILMGGVLLEDGASGISFVLDLTAQYQAEKVLRERTELLESVLSTIPHQVSWKDRNSVYLGCNDRFALAAGLSAPEQVVGKRDTDLPWTPEETEASLQEDRRVLAGKETVLNIEETYRHDDGGTTVRSISKLPLHDAEGAVMGVLGVSHDITARKALEAERERLLHRTESLLVEARERADRDPLTNLLNHRAFHSLFEQEAVRVEREGVALAVVVLDLDNFKFFNDSYGHGIGDEVLRMMAQRLQTACRSYDTVGRFGGDEFALLLPGAGHTTAAEIEARLRAELAGLTFLPNGHGTAIPITVSVGAALLTPGVQDRLTVLREADERLLRDKTGGAIETEAQQVRASALRRVQGFSMLDALVTAVDNKDRYTRRHSEDVMTYSLMIARALGMDEAAEYEVAVSALLHDVGKIGVPDAILRKPGRLTATEFEAIQQHPQMGAIMVGAVPGLEVTLDAVRHHHERWDGGGYPFGLCREECPLIARLMAVADAFSAMTTDRPYRRGMDQKTAMIILAEGAGTQWDPLCVEAFAEALGVSPSKDIPENT